MKKSTLYFALGIATMLLCALFPPVLGHILLKENDVPADFLSSIWIKSFNFKTHQRIPEEIEHVKIVGNGHSSFVVINKSDSTFINSAEFNHFSHEIKADTLILTLHKNAQLILRCKNDIKEIKFINSETSLRLTNQDSISIIAQDNSTINVSNKDSVLINNLSIKLHNKSILDLTDLKTFTLNASIDNGALYYNSKLAVDSLKANLQGMSVVRCNNPDEFQQVKNLILSGNKQYFKDSFAGKNVKVTIK